MPYRNVYDDLKAAQSKVLVRIENPLLHDAVCKLREALIDGLSDHISLPEVSTENGMAAHDLLGCPLYTGLLNVVHYSNPEVSEIAPAVSQAMHMVVVEAVTGMATRLIIEGQHVLREEYGEGHIHEEGLQ